MMPCSATNTDALDEMFRLATKEVASDFPIIACLFTGQIPDQCEPMPRNPSPRLGMEFNREFGREIVNAWRENAATHDGAIMLGRHHPDDKYTIQGWSYRLFPPSRKVTAPINRGSAFNSCLAMSLSPRVDRLYLATRDGIFQFISGVSADIANNS